MSIPADLGIGIGKGALSTAGSLINLFSNITTQPLPSGPAAPVKPEWSETSNLSQDVGKFGEQMGEFAVGGGLASGATKGMGLLGRMAGQGVAGAGVSGLHGGSPSEMAGTGVITSMMPLIGKIVSDIAGAVGDRLGDTLLGRMAGRYVGRTPKPPINAEFVNEPAPPAPNYMDAEIIPPQPQPPRTQLGAGRVQYGQAPPPVPPGQLMPPNPPRLPPWAAPEQISGTAPETPQLGPAPGYIVPRGTGLPMEADPRLPNYYSSLPAQSPEPPPGTMGPIRIGEEGGIPKRGEQTVTGVKPKPTRGEQGRMQKGTSEELLKKKGTPGKTAAEPPKKPTPKKKK